MKKCTLEKSLMSVSSVESALLKHGIWRLIGEHIQEKNLTCAKTVESVLPRLGIWELIGEHIQEKSLICAKVVGNAFHSQVL